MDGSLYLAILLLISITVRSQAVDSEGEKIFFIPAGGEALFSLHGTDLWVAGGINCTDGLDYNITDNGIFFVDKSIPSELYICEGNGVDVSLKRVARIVQFEATINEIDIVEETTPMLTVVRDSNLTTSKTKNIELVLKATRIDIQITACNGTLYSTDRHVSPIRLSGNNVPVEDITLREMCRTCFRVNDGPEINILVNFKVSEMLSINCNTTLQPTIEINELPLTDLVWVFNFSLSSIFFGRLSCNDTDIVSSWQQLSVVMGIYTFRVSSRVMAKTCPVGISKIVIQIMSGDQLIRINTLLEIKGLLGLNCKGCVLHGGFISYMIDTEMGIPVYGFSDILTVELSNSRLLNRQDSSQSCGSSMLRSVTQCEGLRVIPQPNNKLITNISNSDVNSEMFLCLNGIQTDIQILIFNAIENINLISLGSQYTFTIVEGVAFPMRMVGTGLGNTSWDLYTALALECSGLLPVYAISKGEKTSDSEVVSLINDDSHIPVGQIFEICVAAAPTSRSLKSLRNYDFVIPTGIFITVTQLSLGRYTVTQKRSIAYHEGKDDVLIPVVNSSRISTNRDLFDLPLILFSSVDELCQVENKTADLSKQTSLSSYSFTSPIIPSGNERFVICISQHGQVGYPVRGIQLVLLAPLSFQIGKKVAVLPNNEIKLPIETVSENVLLYLLLDSLSFILSSQSDCTTQSAVTSLRNVNGAVSVRFRSPNDAGIYFICISTEEVGSWIQVKETYLMVTSIVSLSNEPEGSVIGSLAATGSVVSVQLGDHSQQVWISVDGQPVQNKISTCAHEISGGHIFVESSISEHQFCLPPLKALATTHSLWISDCRSHGQCSSLTAPPKSSYFVLSSYSVSAFTLSIGDVHPGELLNVARGSNINLRVTGMGITPLMLWLSIQELGQCGTNDVSSKIPVCTKCNCTPSCDRIGSTVAVEVSNANSFTWTLSSEASTAVSVDVPLEICVAAKPSTATCSVDYQVPRGSYFYSTGISFTVASSYHLIFNIQPPPIVDWSGELTHPAVVSIADDFSRIINSHRTQKKLLAYWKPKPDGRDSFIYFLDSSQSNTTIDLKVQGLINVPYKLFITSDGMTPISSNPIIINSCPYYDNISRYALPAIRRVSACPKCPLNAVCNGTEFLLARKGYWHAGPNSPVIYPCGRPQGSDSCYEGDTCGEGYKSYYNNPRCSICESGYGKAWGTEHCAKCGSYVSNVIIFSSGVVLATLAVGLFILLTLQPKKHDPFAVLIKITISHLTIASRCGSFSSNLQRTLQPLYTFQTTVGEIPTEYSAANCLFELNFYNKLIVVNLMPLIVTCVVGIIFMVLKLTRVIRAYRKRTDLNQTTETMSTTDIEMPQLQQTGESNFDMTIESGDRSNSLKLNAVIEPPPLLRDDEGDDINQSSRLENISHCSTISIEDGYEQNWIAAKLGIDHRKLWVVWVQTMVVFLFLIYPTLLQVNAKLFQCETISRAHPSTSPEYQLWVNAVESSLPSEDIIKHDDLNHNETLYLMADRSITCEGSTYNNYQVAAIVCIILTGVGIPFGGMLLISKLRKKRGRSATYKMFSFVLSGYRTGNSYGTIPDRWWWESVVMLRKAAIVFVVEFGASSSEESTVWTSFVAILVLMIAVALQQVGQPYRTPGLNHLESLSLSTILLTLNIGLLYVVKWSDGYYVLDPDSTHRDRRVLFYVVTLLLALINCLVMILLFYFIAAEATKKLRKVIFENQQLMEYVMIYLPQCVLKILVYGKMLNEEPDFCCQSVGVLNLHNKGSSQLVALSKFEGQQDNSIPVLLLPCYSFNLYVITAVGGDGGTRIELISDVNKNTSTTEVGRFYAQPEQQQDNLSPNSIVIYSKGKQTRLVRGHHRTKNETAKGWTLTGRFKCISLYDVKKMNNVGRYKVAIKKPEVTEDDDSEGSDHPEDESDWSTDEDDDAPQQSLSNAEQYFREVGALHGFRYYICHGLQGDNLRIVSEQLQLYAAQLEVDIADERNTTHALRRRESELMSQIEQNDVLIKDLNRTVAEALDKQSEERDARKQMQVESQLISTQIEKLELTRKNREQELDFMKSKILQLESNTDTDNEKHQLEEKYEQQNQQLNDGNTELCALRGRLTTLEDMSHQTNYQLTSENYADLFRAAATSAVPAAVLKRKDTIEMAEHLQLQSRIEQRRTTLIREQERSIQIQDLQAKIAAKKKKQKIRKKLKRWFNYALPHKHVPKSVVSEDIAGRTSSPRPVMKSREENILNSFVDRLQHRTPPPVATIPGRILSSSQLKKPNQKNYEDKKELKPLREGK